MNLRLKFAVVLLLSLFAFSLAHVPTAWACSGGRPSTLNELVEAADIVVRGQLVEVDAAGQNGVMRVESYLTGEPGPEYILLTLHDPASIDFVRVTTQVVEKNQKK